jgi:hypothetical protein
MAAVMSLSMPSALRVLILSNNTGLTGNVQDIQLPSSIQALHIAYTNISGTFDAAWMSRQPAGLGCLVAYNTSGLCGQLDSSLPCSLVQFVDGTRLSKCGWLSLGCLVLHDHKMELHCLMSERSASCLLPL